MSLQTQEVVNSHEKHQHVLQLAEKHMREAPDWVTFFREVLGVEGIVRKVFPSFDELARFEQSSEFDQIQQMLVKLREKRTTADAEIEPTRVITVRLPKSMHEYLRTEAHDLRTSMNKLCISKLLQVIGEDKIPNERTASSKPRTAAVSSPGNPSSGTSPMNSANSHGPSISTPSAGTALGSTEPSSPPPFKSSQPRF